MLPVVAFVEDVGTLKYRQFRDNFFGEMNLVFRCQTRINHPSIPSFLCYPSSALLTLSGPTTQRGYIQQVYYQTISTVSQAVTYLVRQNYLEGYILFDIEF
jgi:hypothetical protein